MNVAVIGAGPAGMMAAGRAAERGHSVVLFETNEKAGKKLYITGKGRCNVTNLCEPEEFLRHVVTNPKFLFSALRCWTPSDTVGFLERHGVKWKEERGRRVFPQSDKASDVTKALEKYLDETGVRREYSTRLTDLETDGAAIVRLSTSKGDFSDFDHVVLACGGASYPSTGSDGNIFPLVARLGHTVIPLKPALVGFDTAPCGDLQGLTLKNVEVSLYLDGKKTAEEFGELLFTHTGVSGPTVLSLSSKANRYDFSVCSGEIRIDLKPALTERQLDERILRDFASSQNRELKNVLKDLLPRRLILPVLRQSGLGEDRKVHSVTAEERQRLKRTLKNFMMTVRSLRPLSEAVVTSGGVDVGEVFPQNMKSRKISNLSFAGEMLDTDAYTGGYNIQIALSTGFLAGDKLA